MLFAEVGKASCQDLDDASAGTIAAMRTPARRLNSAVEPPVRLQTGSHGYSI